MGEADLNNVGIIWNDVKSTQQNIHYRSSCLQTFSCGNVTGHIRPLKGKHPRVCMCVCVYVQE